jgi:hypothetical protein
MELRYRSHVAIEDLAPGECTIHAARNSAALTPSVLCRACRLHGHITAGVWIAAG